MVEVQADLTHLIEGKTDEERVEVPVAWLRALLEGKCEQMLTTQEAADLLGVSRPFVVKLIDGGELPAQKVGTHRRVREGDVLNYERARQLKADTALDEITRSTEELGLYDHQR